MARDENDVREDLLDLLLARVADDRYPSKDMLDIVEQLITPDETDAYASVLMDKIKGEMYPSLSMVRRVMALG